MKFIRFSIFFLLFLVSTVYLPNTFAQEPYGILQHERRINSIAFSPDGKTIASESEDNTVRLWNTTTGTLIHTLEHEGRVLSIAFSPDGKTIASGSRDRTVRLWNTTTGALIHTLEHEGWVLSIAFSPDGKIIASGSGDNTVRLWNTTTGTLIREPIGHGNDVLSIVFSPDGKIIASESEDDTVRLWNATTGTLIHTLEHESEVNSIAFSPDGKTIASESEDNTARLYTVRLWDTTTGALIHTLEHEAHVDSIAFSPDGKTVVSGSWDDTVRLWNATTGTLIHELIGHEDIVYSVAFSSDGKTIVSGGQDRTVRFWDVATGTSTIFNFEEEPIYDPVFSPDWQRFASHDGYRIFLWDFSTRVNIVPVEVESPPIGDSVVIDINIVGGKDVRGYDLTLRYRSEALRYVSHTLGDYLPGEVFVGPTISSPSASVFSLSATSPAGVSNGDGTLATITFEVLERTASEFVLSGTLSDSDGRRLPFVVSYGRVITPPWDVNGDDSVDILDLSYVAARFGQQNQPKADVNGDGVVDIKDLIVVASGMPGAAAAPATWHRGMESMPTRADVQQWLAQAQRLNLTDVAREKGIFFLESLLAALAPQETSLLPNYPNPFNPETWIPYQLAEPANVMLTIYDIQGRVVRDLDLGHQRTGLYHSQNRAAYWDGRNAHGESVASGVYFYTLTAGDFSATRKMLITK